MTKTDRMFVSGTESNDFTETYTEGVEVNVATWWTSRYNKDVVLSKATCLVARD